MRTSLPARAGQPSAVSASRIPSPEQTIRQRMSARPGPALSMAWSNRRRASIWALLGSDPAADPHRPPETGAESQIMVTRGASCARSQSARSRSPASNCRWLTRPRANSHPSGDSVTLTVTDLTALRAPETRPSNSITCSRSNFASSANPLLLPCRFAILATSAKL